MDGSGTAFSPQIALTAGAGLVALVGLLAAERAGARLWVWITKTVTSTSFLAAALLWGGLGSAYGRWLVLALILSWLGDLLLIPEGEKAFVAGLGSFLAAHLVFALAFGALARPGPALIWATVAMIGVAGLALRWLWPHLPRPLRLPVLAYLVAISAMVATAAGAAAGGGSARWIVGAVAFAVSDLAVARHQFVAPGFGNRLWGLPLYYAAQWTLASTALGSH